MGSATIGFLMVDVIVHFVDGTLLSSALLLFFVYTIIILIPANAQNRYTRDDRSGGVGGDNPDELLLREL